MRRVLYSKFSSERKKEYRISTQIVSVDGKRVVIKRGLGVETKEHICKIAGNKEKLSAISLDDRLEIAEVVQTGENELEFEYIDGVRMDAVIDELVRQKDYAGLIAEIKRFESCITNTKALSQFENTEAFTEVFGENNCQILNGEKAFSISNIDLIFENIIIRDGRYVVTDYEWVFEFLVPVKYIIYRSILLSSSINSIDDKSIVDKIYDAFMISRELRELFYKMEKNFQYFVSNRNIFEEYAKKSTNKTARVLQAVESIGESYIRVYDMSEKKSLLEIIRYNGQQIEFSCDIRDKKSICLEFDMNYAVIKFEKVKAVRDDMTECDAGYETNADLEIGRDYYFKEKNPSIEIKNDGYDRVCINAFVYYENTSIIGNHIDLILENADIKSERANLSDRLVCREYDVKSLEERLADSENKIKLLEEQNRQKDERIAKFENIIFYKAYRKLFKK